MSFSKIFGLNPFRRFMDPKTKKMLKKLYCLSISKLKWATMRKA
jgi:hypothetical protein